MNNEQITTLLAYLIGSRYVPSVKAYITELTGRPLVVGPGDVSTMDYNPQRIQVNADNAGRITGFGFA
jgi:hypothetical protein